MGRGGGGESKWRKNKQKTLGVKEGLTEGRKEAKGVKEGKGVKGVRGMQE